MMDIQIECTYCGHKTNKVIYSKEALKYHLGCTKCSSTEVITRELSRYDFYAGAPEFSSDERARWATAKRKGVWE